jgi:hypothetical protein
LLFFHVIPNEVRDLSEASRTLLVVSRDPTFVGEVLRFAQDDTRGEEPSAVMLPAKVVHLRVRR